MRSRRSSVKSGDTSVVADVDEGEGRHSLNLNVLFDAWLASRAATGALDAALAPSGLSADEFAIYSVLRTNESMTPTELARWMSAPPTSVTSYVKRLESRGHIERTPHPGDGRSYTIQLSTAGRAAHLAAGELFQPVLARVVRNLGDQTSTVRAGLCQLHAALVS